MPALANARQMNEPRRFRLYRALGRLLSRTVAILMRLERRLPVYIPPDEASLFRGWAGKVVIWEPNAAARAAVNPDVVVLGDPRQFGRYMRFCEGRRV